mgnify:CR=1 FL=1
MTTNHHTPIATTAPANAATWNTPLSSLDSAITNLAAGTTGLTGLRLATATTLTISGGAVTKTGSQHTIDTEASASSDDLTTINGYATGDILIISAANASRVVTVKHGTGNIYLYGKMDLVLDDTDKTIELIYRGGRWEQTNGLPTTAVTYPTAAPFRRPSTMPLMMSPAARNFWGIKASAATAQPIGIAAPTITGAAAANQSDSTYISHTTGAIAGNSAGIVTATYNLVRRAHNPKLSMVMQITDTAAVRYWLGFFSAAATTADTVAGATECAAFRFSSVASDTGWVPVTKDASTQTTGSAMNTIAAATRYLLEIELTSSGAIFTVNNGTPVTIATNLPTTSTELGVNVIAFTTAAAAKVWQFSRLFVEYD